MINLVVILVITQIADSMGFDIATNGLNDLASKHRATRDNLLASGPLPAQNLQNKA